MSVTIPKGILGYTWYKLKQIFYSKESIEVNVELERDQRHNHLCSICNKKASPERTKRREVKDLLFHGWKTSVIVEYYEVKCEQCGVRVEHIPFVRPYARATKRLEEAVAWLCQHLPLTVVAMYFSLNWKTVKNIDKAYLEHRFEAPSLDNITVIGIDEVSYRKGHKYLTCVFDLNNSRLIWVGIGKNKETVSKFFKTLGEERSKRIKAVAIDMSKAYIGAVKEHCPKALIVHDKFHIIQDFNKVMDRIRIDEFKKADEEHKGFFKKTKWLLVMNPKRLKDEGEIRLKQLLNINMPLNIAYTLLEQLKELWECVTVAQFNRALDNWCDMAYESNIQPLMDFADMLKVHRSGLWSYCLYPINTAILEGNNRKIGLIRRKACGFHDLKYFILKIFQADNPLPLPLPVP